MPRDLLWKTWDEEEFLVFHVPSGNTHLLNQVSALALKVLEREAHSIEELAHELASRLDCEADAELIEYVRQLLVGFEDLGLIEQAP